MFCIENFIRKLFFQARIYNVRYREDIGFGRKHVVQGQPIARRLTCTSSPQSVFIEMRFQGLCADKKRCVLQFYAQIFRRHNRHHRRDNGEKLSPSLFQSSFSAPMTRKSGANICNRPLSSANLVFKVASSASHFGVRASLRARAHIVACMPRRRLK